MSRFNNLELGGHFEDHSQGAKPALKDAPHYLAEARRSLEQGRFERALRSYAKVLEYDPRSVEAWAGQVRMLIELGEVKEAKLWADKALDLFPEEAELLAAKAVALARTGDLRAAMTFSDAAVEAKVDLPYVWLARGDVLLARREKRADYCFERALSLAPHDWFIPWLASRVFYFYKQFCQALKLAQQAIGVDATQAPLWMQFGRCQMALGLAAPAANSFEQARQLDPEWEPSEMDVDQLQNAGLFSRLRGQWRQLFGK